MRKWKQALASSIAAAPLMLSPLLAHQALADPRADAQGQVKQSTAVLHHMEKDSHIRAALHRAKGVLIIPRYAQGGLVVGGNAGEGVLVARTPKGTWSDPAFYNVGGVSLGLQAGGEGGSIALILLSQKALNDVMGGQNFSLDSKAGLSVINYSAKTQAGWGRADVLVWSDVKGAYAGATIAVQDIAQDQQQNHAYYGRLVTVNQIIGGKVRNPAANQLVASLR